MKAIDLYLVGSEPSAFFGIRWVRALLIRYNIIITAIFYLINYLICVMNVNYLKKSNILNLHFHFLALVSRQSAALSSATQCIQILAESVEWSVLTLGSPYTAVCGIQREADFIW